MVYIGYIDPSYRSRDFVVNQSHIPSGSISEAKVMFPKEIMENPFTPHEMFCTCNGVNNASWKKTYTGHRISHDKHATTPGWAVTMAHANNPPPPPPPKITSCPRTGVLRYL